MSRTDAYVRLICDTCMQDEEVELPFTYPNLSGQGGRYDHTTVRLPKGWVCIGDDKHECPNCVEDRLEAEI